MKLCAPCMKVLEGRDGVLCKDCREQVRGVLDTQPPSMEPPEFWVPAEGEHVGIPGMSRMGKSTFMKGWTGYLMEEGVPVFWWDPQREASQQGIKRAKTPLGPLKVQVTVSDLAMAPKRWLSYRKSTKAQATAIVPDKPYPGRAERSADFVRFMDLFLPNKPEGQVVLFIEESGLLEGDRKAETALVEAATTWAKEGVTMVFGTQSTAMLPSLVRRQVKKLVCYAQRDKFDLLAVRDLATPRFARVVGQLQPHECLLANRMDLGPWKDRDGQAEDSPEETGVEQAA